MPHITPTLSDSTAAFEYDQLDNSVDALRKSIANRLVYAVGKDLRTPPADLRSNQDARRALFGQRPR